MRGLLPENRLLQEINVGSKNTDTLKKNKTKAVKFVVTMHSIEVHFLKNITNIKLCKNLNYFHFYQSETNVDRLKYPRQLLSMFF